MLVSGTATKQQKLSRWIKGMMAPDPLVPLPPDPGLAMTAAPTKLESPFSYYILALLLFRFLIQHLLTHHENQNTEQRSKLSFSRMSDDMGRLKACAGCLGINKPESNSMLASMPEVLMHCSKLLEKLTGNLQKAISLVLPDTGKETLMPEQSVQLEVLGLKDLDFRIPCNGSHKSELVGILAGITHTIDCLCRLSSITTAFAVSEHIEYNSITNNLGDIYGSPIGSTKHPAYPKVPYRSEERCVTQTMVSFPGMKWRKVLKTRLLSS